jgi:hypothetical protein
MLAIQWINHDIPLMLHNHANDETTDPGTSATVNLAK